MTGCGLNFGKGLGSDNCCCDFPTLVILILIILQFGRKKHRDHDEKDGLFGDNNGILFIIALFFLACCGCGKKM